MAFKQFVLDEHTTVTIYKRKASRNLRLTITSDGMIRVSIPAWAPYRAGLEFAKSRRGWIDNQRRRPQLLIDGQALGKAHHLRLTPSLTAVRAFSRLKQSDVVVTYPHNLAPTHPAVQNVASAAAIRALRRQAEQLLPQRLARLAEIHGFKYHSVSIKQLKSRWGSCDHQTNIILNLYLMQLPWELIDYVILHELAHTKVLRHGPAFWQVLETVLSDAKQRRTRLRRYQPVLDSSPANMA
jgi:predicted metal-dependent hydrolase